MIGQTAVQKYESNASDKVNSMLKTKKFDAEKGRAVNVKVEQVDESEQQLLKSSDSVQFIPQQIIQKSRLET
jgi:molybdopterin converting factor small subunit